MFSSAWKPQVAIDGTAAVDTPALASFFSPEGSSLVLTTAWVSSFSDEQGISNKSSLLEVLVLQLTRWPLLRPVETVGSFHHD